MFKLESIVIMLTIDIKGICILNRLRDFWLCHTLILIGYACLNELRDNSKNCEHVHCVSMHFIVKELVRRVL